MTRYFKHLLTLPGDLIRYGDTYTNNGHVWMWSDRIGWVKMSAHAASNDLPDAVYRHPFPFLRLLLWLVVAFLVVHVLGWVTGDVTVDLSVQVFLFGVPLMNRKAFLLGYYFKEKSCGVFLR